MPCRGCRCWCRVGERTRGTRRTMYARPICSRRHCHRCVQETRVEMTCKLRVARKKSGTIHSICAHPASMSPQSSDSVSDDHVSRHAEQPSESTGCSALRACSRRTANTASPIRTAAVHVCASSSPCLGPDASQPTRRRSIAYAPASHVSRTNLQDSSTELRPEQTHSRCHRMDVRSLTNIDINIDMVGAGAKAKAETETKTKTKTELE